MDSKDLDIVFRRLESFGFEFKGGNVRGKTYKECIDGIIKVINYLDGQRLAAQEKLEIETIKNGKLRRKIAKYPEEIKDEISVAVLQQRKLHAKRMEAVNEKLESVEKNVEYLQEECETLRAGNAVLEEAIKKANAEEKQLEGLLRSKKEDSLRALRKLADAENQLQIIQPKLEQLQHKMSNLQRTLAKCDLKNARQNDPNMILEKKLEEIKNAVVRKEVAIKKHYDSITKLQTTQNNISDELENSDQALHVCAQRAEATKEEYGRFIELLTAEKADFPILEDRQQQLKDEICALEEEQKQVEERLTASLKQIELKISREQKKSTHLKNSRTKLRKELDSNERQLWELTEKKEKLRTHIEDLKKEIEQKTNETKDMNQEIQKVNVTKEKEVANLKKEIRDLRDKVKRKQKLMDQEKQMSVHIKRARGKQSAELQELIESSQKSRMDIAMDIALTKDKLRIVTRQVTDLSLHLSENEKEGEMLKVEVENLTLQCEKMEADEKRTIETLQQKEATLKEQLVQLASEKSKWQRSVEDRDFEAQSKSFEVSKLQRTVTALESKQQSHQSSVKQLLELQRKLGEAKVTLKNLIEESSTHYHKQMKSKHQSTLKMWKEILGVKGQLQVIKQENENMEQMNHHLRQECEIICSEYKSLSKTSKEIMEENGKLTKKFSDEWQQLQEYHQECTQKEENYVKILQQLGSDAAKTTNIIKTAQTTLKLGINKLSKTIEMPTYEIPSYSLIVV